MNIYKKLQSIQLELKAPKGQFNKFGNYYYRSCEDILEGVKALLLKNNCVINVSDELVMIGERYYIKATATLIDIESAERLDIYGYAREEESKKGMDGSQVTGASSSYARKYALNGLFAIDDAKDSDGTNTHGREEEPPGTEKTKLTEKQVGRLFGIAKDNGYEVGRVKAKIMAEYKVKDVAGLSKAQYDKICASMESNPKK